MLVYLIMYFIIIINHVYVNKIGSERKNNLHLLVSFLTILIVISLRHPSMGNDLGGYIDSFLIIGGLSVKETIHLNSFLNYEWGYIVFNKLISLITNDPQALIAISAIFSIVPIGLLIKKRSSNYIFSILVYLGLPFFMMVYSGLRQAIAIGFCCLGLLEIRNKKLKRFMLWIGLAFLFHSSAAVFLLAYPLYHIKLNKIGRILSIPLLAVIYLFRLPIFKQISRLFKDDAIPDNNNSFMLLAVFVLIYLFCTVFIENDDYDNASMLNIYYFACVCQCFAGVYNTAMRIGYYFMPALIIALPNIVSKQKNKRNMFLFSIILQIIFILYGLYSIYKSSWAMAYPYHFFWETI